MKKTFEFVNGVWEDVTSHALTKVGAVGGVAAMGLGLSLNASAVAPDFSSLTAAADFSTAISAILLVAAGLAGVAIVVYGIKLILPMLKGRA